MRGRIGWRRKVLQPDGTFKPLSEEQSQAHITRLRALSRGINADVLNTPEEVAEEKRRRLTLSKAFTAAQRRGLKSWIASKREDVKARNLRIDQIADIIRKPKWEGRTAAYIAQQLAKEMGLSVNTLRLDVREARKRHGLTHPKRKKI